MAWFIPSALRQYGYKPMPFLPFLVNALWDGLAGNPFFFSSFPAVKNCNLFLQLFYRHREPPANGGPGA